MNFEEYLIKTENTEKTEGKSVHERINGFLNDVVEGYLEKDFKYYTVLSGITNCCFSLSKDILEETTNMKKSLEQLPDDQFRIKMPSILSMYANNMAKRIAEAIVYQTSVSACMPFDIGDINTNPKHLVAYAKMYKSMTDYITDVRKSTDSLLDGFGYNHDFEELITKYVKELIKNFRENTGDAQ